ncbi:M23 family metallopeptidase [bacterium]|nr:M23 family metallopeptidase [bacterium]
MFALLLALAAPSHAGDFLYPMKLRPIVTGTFGEYRLNHPHGGVDLGTEGREGVPVVAAKAGRIVQMRCSSLGYGKVVYLAHADGTQTVYAHLSEFGGALDPIARGIWAKSGRFSFRREFGGGGPRVEAGEVIGYSGMTGTDVPHLHFEIRRGLPVNPLASGLAITDTIAPVVTRLLAEPLSANAHADGSFDRKIVAFADGMIAEPVVVGGRVGLAVEVIDRADGSERDLAPYEIAFSIDGRTVYRNRYDRFDYADKRHSELDYHYELKETKKGVFHRLFAMAGRTIFHPENLAGDLSGLAAGDHAAEIVARDAAGNVGRGRFTLRVVAGRAAATAPSAPAMPQGERAAEFSLRERVLIASILGEVRAASASLSPGGDARASIETGTDGARIFVDLPPGFGGTASIKWQDANGTNEETANLQAVRNGATITTPDGDATIALPAGAAYRPFSVLAGTRATPAGEGLERLSPLYAFSPMWEPLRQPARVTVNGGVGRGVGLYLHDRGTWWHLANGRTSDVVHLGEFALMRDVSPPAIGEARVEWLRGRPVLAVEFSDAGSGVAEGGFDLSVDGRRVMAEPNPAAGRVSYLPAEGLLRGTRHVRLTVTDRAGLSATREFELVVGEAPDVSVGAAITP